MKKIMTAVLALTLALGLLAGCGQTGSAAGEETISGSVATDGSTSMEAVIGALGEAFMLANPDVTVTYNPTGSGSGIAVIVHPDTPVADLSLEQITAIYTGQITDWSEVGGEEGEIVLIGREAGSGTRDGFESITGTEDACLYRQELTSTGDVITAVSQNPGAIGYASLSAVSDLVKAVTVDAVAASEETVLDGSYRIQRPFVLVTRDGEELSPAAQAFFAYVTSADASGIIAAAGAVAAAA